jgi:DNA-binding CsgD family transcriptional regulator
LDERAEVDAAVDWLHRVYLPSLEPHVARLLGARAVHGTPLPDASAAWLGLSASQLADARHALSEGGLPPAGQGRHGAAALAVAWQLHQPARAGKFIRAALNEAIALRDAPLAARLARLGTSAKDCARVLSELGWVILLGTARDELGDLLARLSPADADRPAMRLLRAAWWVEVRRAPTEAERVLAGARIASPIAGLIRARCNLMYDEAAKALACAQAAHADLPAGSPQAQWASAALGYAWLECAQPVRAIGVLLDAVRCARRDGLLNLELDALHALARAQQECSDDAALDATLNQVRSLLPQVDARSVAAQSLARLMLREAHERLETPASATSGPDDSHLFAFPWLAARARAALIEGRIQVAAEWSKLLASRLHASFCGAKWALEAGFVRIWLAGLRGDVEALRREAAGPGIPSEHTGLHAWTLAVHQAAAALLAHVPWTGAQLQALTDALQARGLHRLHATTSLIAALSDDSDTLGRLGRWLALAARNGRVLDACWLAPRLLDPLSAWLRHPSAPSDPGAHALAAMLMQRLQDQASSSPSVEPALRPDELTEREWQVLQLIARQFSNEQIAATLHVSLPTVKTHINRLYAKLGLRSRAEARLRGRALSAKSP